MYCRGVVQILNNVSKIQKEKQIKNRRAVAVGAYPDDISQSKKRSESETEVCFTIKNLSFISDVRHLLIPKTKKNGRCFVKISLGKPKVLPPILKN